jgi:hypothetical protein
MLNLTLPKEFFLTSKRVFFNMVLEHLLKPECAVLCDILVSSEKNQNKNGKSNSKI